MFSIAFLVGIYVQGLIVLGLLHLYSFALISLYTVAFIFLSIYCWKYFDEQISLKSINEEMQTLWEKHKTLALLIFLSIIVVVTGVLVPEIAFDSLWYHLTLPKMFLSSGGITFIPGSLFYYSALPKFGEFLYLIPVGLQIEQLGKAIHALFGLGTCIVLYQIAKSQTNRYYGLLSVVVFLSNIVVLWQATTTYVDLMRTFFETLTLYGLILFDRTGKRKWLIESAISMGLAIETKLISLGTLVAYSVFIFLSTRVKRLAFRHIFIFVFFSLLVPLPWFVFSYVHTGNPIYPIFTGFNPPFNFSIRTLLMDGIFVFLSSHDPVSPIYLLSIPLIPLVWRKMSAMRKKLLLTALACFVVWLFTPRTAGGRFLMAYLPLFSTSVVIVLSHLSTRLQGLMAKTVIILFLVGILYRGLAQMDTLKVAFGLQSKNEYLVHTLNYSFGDFYDTDNFFKNTLDQNEKVLLVGFHNLYYADFAFVDQSYQKDSDVFSYVATQNTVLPEKYRGWVKVYTNNTTHVSVYRDPERGER